MSEPIQPGADKIRQLIAARAATLAKQPGAEEWAKYTDEGVAAGRYRPTMNAGTMAVEVYGGALAPLVEPQAFQKRYGHVPPDFAEQWLSLQRARAQSKAEDAARWGGTRAASKKADR